MKLHIKNAALGTCPHSFANFEELAVQHALLILSLDFSSRDLLGICCLRILRHSKTSSVIKLDINKLITIKRCSSLDGARKVGHDVTAYSSLGDCLELDLSFLVQNNEKDYVDVRIEYSVATGSKVAVSFL